MKNNTKSALELAHRGWPIFPTHSTDKAGSCSCGSPDCSSAGKHPRTASGLKEATTDEQTIRDWWATWPDANVAVRTGEVSGIFVLDVDIKKGAKGDESLSALEKEHGKLPETLSATTWSGGEHQVFNYPGHSVKNRTGFRPGLDIRGDGGYVLVAPSEIGGHAYQWDNIDSAIADAPDWLLETIANREGSSNQSLSFSSQSAQEGFSEGSRNDGLFRHACSLRNKDLPYDQAKILIMNAAAECNPPLSAKEAIQCLDSAYKRYEPGTSRPLTELGNAERLVDRFGKFIRFIPDFNSWMYWDNGSWVFDKLGEINLIAKEVIRGIHHEATHTDNPEIRETILKHAKSSEKKSAIDNMIVLASREADIPIHAHFLDLNPWHLGVSNGVVDLKSGELRPAKPDDYITKQGDVNYEPGAACPLWEQFLLQIMGGDKELVQFLQRSVGYTHTGTTREQAVFVLHGTGANGKSTFLEVLEKIMGDYCKSVASETLMMQKGRSSSGPNEDIARLKGARLAATSETEEGQVLAEALVKRMTGEDTLVARLPYAKNSFEFKPQFKVWMAANHKPIIRGDDHAIWRRIHLIPFEQTFEGKAQDKSLKQKLLAELPGILNWMIKGCLNWQKEGLNPPAQIQDATRGYRDEMDLLAEWMEMSCEISPEREATTGELYTSFHSWCDSNVMRPMSRNVFGRKIKSRGFQDGKINGQRGFRGIGVKKSDDYLKFAS